jgi:hypothetical protein
MQLQTGPCNHSWIAVSASLFGTPLLVIAVLTCSQFLFNGLRARDRGRNAAECQRCGVTSSKIPSQTGIDPGGIWHTYDQKVLRFCRTWNGPVPAKVYL